MVILPLWVAILCPDISGLHEGQNIAYDIVHDPTPEQL